MSIKRTIDEVIETVEHFRTMRQCSTLRALAATTTDAELDDILESAKKLRQHLLSEAKNNAGWLDLWRNWL
jgi:hypothetical protein